jgi:hypothetical protein
MRHGHEVSGTISLQYLELSERGHLRSTPLEQLCTWPNDAATVGNIFGTPTVK